LAQFFLRLLWGHNLIKTKLLIIVHHLNDEQLLYFITILIEQNFLKPNLNNRIEMGKLIKKLLVLTGSINP